MAGSKLGRRSAMHRNQHCLLENGPDWTPLCFQGKLRGGSSHTCIQLSPKSFQLTSSPGSAVILRPHRQQSASLSPSPHELSTTAAPLHHHRRLHVFKMFWVCGLGAHHLCVFHFSSPLPRKKNTNFWTFVTLVSAHRRWGRSQNDSCEVKRAGKSSHSF